MTYDTSDALWIYRLLWIVNLAYEVNCNMKHTPNWLLEEITIRCSFDKLHCWSWQRWKKCQKWLFNCLTTESQSAWLSTYLVIITQSLVHGPLVNPFQYHNHIIGSGAGGGGGRGGYSSSERKWEGSSAPRPSSHRSLWMFQSALIRHLRTYHLRCHHHLFNK